MLLGGIATKYFTPETSDIWGRSRSLPDLSLGKAHRKRLIEKEKNEEKERKKQR
jgi:hypothetical protein